MNTIVHLVSACLAMVLLTFAVGLRMLYVRAAEMREMRIHPQGVATSIQTAAKLLNVQAADNFRNLFEAPVLLYALVAIAMAAGYTPQWLAYGCWTYVTLRVAHSFIHCTYNRVMHRFTVFGTSFLILVGMWVALLVGVAAKG